MSKYEEVPRVWCVKATPAGEPFVCVPSRREARKLAKRVAGGTWDADELVTPVPFFAAVRRVDGGW